MHPYSKRPFPTHAHTAAPASVGPRVEQPRSVFYRQEAIGPASYGHGYPAAPPPPGSLAPMAMSQYTDWSHPTGPAAAITNAAQILGERPPWRVGAMILLAGLFVGGTFGVGVQARRNAMDAEAEMANAAAAPAHAAAPPPVAIAPAPVQAAAPGPTALQQIPPQAPPQLYAEAPAAAGLPPGAIIVPAQVPGAAPMAPPAQPIAAAPPSVPAQPAHASAPQPRRAPAAHAPSKPAPAHGMVAAKVTTPKADKPAPAPPPEKPSSKRAQTEEQKLLQDAIGATTNTL